jgi:hypothetical protein
MTEDERIEQLVAAAPRPTREQLTKLALLLTGDASQTGDDEAQRSGGCAA